jgi:hypothetical protein
MSAHKPSRIAPFAGLLLAIAGYVGAYLYWFHTPVEYDTLTEFVADYDRGCNAFAPLIWIDRRLRPEIWNSLPTTLKEIRIEHQH